MEGTIGEIRVFAGNFAPVNWAICNGASLSIAEYEALYTLIGTTYGGDGQVTFNVPNLCSRVPVGAGQGIGLPNIILGQIAGSESASMSSNQMPSHNHIGTGSISIPTLNEADTLGSPTDAELAGLPAAYSTEVADSFLKAETSTVTLTPTGQGQPFSIMQPYTASNYIICTLGVFPSRN
ncbi:phage tail protein [Flavobacterium sp. N1736]|uniref:phage tail protein n=1 Tax=Flavobacterium sp. N1736 TaxID=2986823 RepID=UPI0022258720|nr:tail fiber protein [Flavobacterium sp. N1736]